MKNSDDEAVNVSYLKNKLMCYSSKNGLEVLGNIKINTFYQFNLWKPVIIIIHSSLKSHAYLAKLT